MPNSTAQKLRIKKADVLLTVNAPSDFEKELGEVPEGVKISTSAEAFNQIHWFVKNRKQMESEVEGLIKLLKDDLVCWIYYPKGSSKMQTDLTRDRGWDALLKHDELQWISLISFNDTWSVFGMRPKTEADRKKGAAPKERAIFRYIDTATKTINLPDDFSKLLDEKRTEKEFFSGLSFTNKKEYVEWIVSAKRGETRANRVKESVARLGKGWKNPANR